MCEACNDPILEFNAIFYCSYLLKVGPLEAVSVKSKRLKKFRTLDSVHIFSASLPCIQTPKFGHYMPQTSFAGCAGKNKVIGLYFAAMRLRCDSLGPSCVCSDQKHVNMYMTPNDTKASCSHPRKKDVGVSGCLN